MSIVVAMPHLDDETFSCGGMLLNHKRNSFINKIKIDNELCYSKDFSLDSDILILTFCKGRADENSGRFKTFKEFCIAVNANHIVLNFNDLELYKNSHSIYIDILTNIFSQIKSDFEVYIPSENDLHQEHRLISQCAKIACRRYLDRISRILEFKQPFENFDRSEYENCFECSPYKESCCKQYKEQQPQYYDKEFYRVLHFKL